MNPTVVNIGMGPRVWKELGRTDERIARIPLKKFAGSTYFHYLTAFSLLLLLLLQIGGLGLAVRRWSR